MLGEPKKVREENLSDFFCAFENFVGVTRLELATSRPPDAYSNQLSYTPIELQKRCKVKYVFHIFQIF